MFVKILMTDGNIAELHLEEYLRGVIGQEISPSSPLAALKAQTVAARSYALYAVKYPRHNEVKAHLCATEHCQAYNIKAINPTSDAAVYATIGEYMTYDGQVIDALYSADCGGRTIGNDEAWGSAPVAYLRPVDCIKKDGNVRGHRVGMCQMGAIWMAQYADRDYRAILRHYYTGIDFAVIQYDESDGV